MSNLKNFSVRAIILLALVATSAVAWLPASLKDDVNNCQACRAAVSYMSRFNTSSQREEYRDVFKSFCEQYYSPSTDYQQGPCPLFIETVFFVIDKTDPIHQCDQIGACGHADLAGLFLVRHQGLEELAANSVEAKNQEIFCRVCESIVKQAKDIARDPESRRRVERAVDSFCDFLRAINEDKECKAGLKRNLSKILKMIEQLDPKTYCRSISLCPATKSTLTGDVQPLPTLADFNNFGIETSVSIGEAPTARDDLVSSSRLSSPECAFCKEFVKEMFKFLRDNRTEESIRDGLDNVCTLIYGKGEKRDQCEGLVKAYTKEIIELLIDETNPQMICILLEQCTYKLIKPAIDQQSRASEIVPVPTRPPKKSGGLNFGDILGYFNSYNSMKSCVECKIVIKYLQETLDNPKSDEKIKMFLLDKICNSVEDADMKQKCQEFVDEYSEAFFKAVSQELNPGTACAELGACKRRPEINGVLKIDNEKPANQYQEQTLATLEPKKTTKKVIKAPRESQICDECVEIISTIDDYISQNSIDQDVDIIITDVCDKLTSDSLKNQCTILVKTMGNEIVQAIASMENPRQLCTKIMLCAN